jgi:hypothetical protein
LLDKINSLNTTDRDKFDRAAVWFKMSRDVYSASTSSSFNALATSIECLLPENKTTCAHCGQPVYEITKKFLDFLSNYSGVLERLVGPDNGAGSEPMPQKWRGLPKGTDGPIAALDAVGGEEKTTGR